MWYTQAEKEVKATLCICILYNLELKKNEFMEEILILFKTSFKILFLTSSIFLLYVSLAVATAAKLLASAVAFGQSTKYDVKWNSCLLKFHRHFSFLSIMYKKCARTHSHQIIWKCWNIFTAFLKLSETKISKCMIHRNLLNKP